MKEWEKVKQHTAPFLFITGVLEWIWTDQQEYLNDIMEDGQDWVEQRVDDGVNAIEQELDDFTEAFHKCATSAQFGLRWILEDWAKDSDFRNDFHIKEVICADDGSEDFAVIVERSE